MSTPVRRDSRRRRSQHSRGALCDPNMIWQSYRACMQRGEKAKAFGNLYKYIELWVESTPRQTQAMRYRMDDGIVFSLAFDETGVEWLLKQRQNGVVSSLEELVTHLTDTLTSTADMNSNEADTPLKQLAVVTLALSRIACCSENLPALKSSKLFQVIDHVCHTCLTAATSATTEDSLKLLLEALTNSIVFLHILLDPRHRWAAALSQHQPLHDEFQGSPMTVTLSVLDVFTLVFNQLPMVVGSRCADEFTDLKIEALHLMGAILTGIESNASIALMSMSDTLLLSLLEPRESCTELQILTVRIIIRMIHVLHCSISEEQLDSVDARVLLSGLFNVLSPRWCDVKLVTPSFELVVSVLKSFGILTHPQSNAAGLKEMLVDIAVMEKVAEILNTMREVTNTHQGVELCCVILKTFNHLLKGSSLAQEAFEQRVGYARLMRHLTAVTTPTREVLTEALSIVTEEPFHAPVDDTISVHNPNMLAMLIRWLPDLPRPQRLWLANQIVELCSAAVHNRQMCCTAGLLRVAIEVLSGSQTEDSYIGADTEDQLLALIEVLGSHSIMAAELKQLIGALRATEDNLLPSYYYKMLQIMCTTGHRKEGISPLYYFDLRHPHSYINVPYLPQWPSSAGFTFHAWVRLDHTSSLSDNSEVVTTPTKHRRMLYSFYSKHTSGLEAFFTENNNLVIATATRKDFHTILVREPLFRTSEWHSVCIVMQVVKKLVSRFEVTLYVDGELVGSAMLKGPGLADKTFRLSYIGSSHGVTNANTSSSPSAIPPEASITERTDAAPDSDTEPESFLSK